MSTFLALLEVAILLDIRKQQRKRGLTPEKAPTKPSLRKEIERAARIGPPATNNTTTQPLTEGNTQFDNNSRKTFIQEIARSSQIKSTGDSSV